MVMLANWTPPLAWLRKLGLFHDTAAPMGKLPALTGICELTTVLPAFTVAYPTVPMTLFGDCHTLPPLSGTDTAKVGMLGPRNCPTIDTAVPVRLMYVPTGPTTFAVKVPAMLLTLITKIVCPFKNCVVPEKPCNTKPSFIVGVPPLYEKVPMLPLPTCSMVMFKDAA